MRLTVLELTVRLIAAMICGGCIGLDRGRKNRSAGMRTHMIICMGSALSMILGIYLSQMAQIWGAGTNTDVSRLGAQVISGIGFIGVGTIIFTGRQRVQGITTAAGLWASACVGLAIGAGFYVAAVAGCVLIVITVTLLSEIERVMFAKTKKIELHIELVSRERLSELLEYFRLCGMEVCRMDVFGVTDGESADGVDVMLMLPKKQHHCECVSNVARQGCVRYVEQI